MILFAATWMDLEIIILHEVKTEKDKYHMISLNVESKKKKELIHKMETDPMTQKTNLPKRKGGGDKLGGWN